MKNDANIIQINSCDRCGRALKQRWKFCAHCGTELITRGCPFCGAMIKPGWNFCPHCQHRVNCEHVGREVFKDSNEWLSSVLEKSTK